MSTVTATGFKHRILEFAAEHELHHIDDSKARRMANGLKRRIERMTDLDRERLVMHKDPVPCEVLHHMLGNTACRRCGREPAS